MKSINGILIVLLFVACRQSTPALPADKTLASKIDAYLTKTVAHLKLPGLTVAVTRNDSVIYTGAFGVTNVDTKKQMKPENIFHWASVSKTFVATAIMQLWEQKKIDLDKKLITYLPYFKQKDKRYRDITIRQMLNHTSGIGDVDDYEWDKPQYDSGALERFVRSIADDEMLFAPGKGWRYSNTAYETLGDVIAKVSGMSFETYIRKNIFDPLEMNATSFLYPEIPDSLKTTGHLWAGKPIVSQHYPYNRMHGVNVVLKGAPVGICTDAEGKFTFPQKLKEGDVLVFSFIGYAPEEYVIRKDVSEVVTIQCKLDADITGEVVVDEVYTAKRGFRRWWSKVQNIF